MKHGVKPGQGRTDEDMEASESFIVIYGICMIVGLAVVSIVAIWRIL